ncbi:beta-glucanase [Parabacteroides sp. An277]|uniref:glycoside hydrolase family 16 protein n=1 Tax=Parabacteroides sp. An277 TaxID=1965619 RepID=UPI000B365ACA|nr:glycoside hydrolase family 16 protein [Parabacteroides sp. An277]OUO54981.1 beta-glucanase [Parabacteroides sp. An277]
MKTKNLLALAIGLFGLLSSCQEQPKEWKLVWEENFEETDSFDPGIWSKIPRGTADWNRHMSDFDSCYAMQNGHLVLRGIVNYSLPNDTSPVLTGGVYTKGKMLFSNGRLEICARLHGAQGAWPAFWLLPEDAPWPQGGEIDIMERLNNDSIAYQTVHSHYTYVQGFKDNPPQGSTGPINREDYNIYAVELYPDSLSFYINDVHTFTYPRIETDKEGQFPFNRPFYLLLDMQLGGSWVGRYDTKDLPVQMEIDWVRFYQK